MAKSCAHSQLWIDSDTYFPFAFPDLVEGASGQIRLNESGRREDKKEGKTVGQDGGA